MGTFTKRSKQELAQMQFEGCPGFYELATSTGLELISQIKEVITEKDIQQFTSKGHWYNLPSGLDGDLIERILYYKGRGVLFYVKTVDRFYFLPFALDGNIDVYGRYLDVQPLIFGGSDDNENDKAFIDGLTKSPIYEVLIPEQVTNEVVFDGCVILNDRVQRRAQFVKPRYLLQEPIINLESNIVGLIRTAIMNKVGIKGVKSTGPEDSSKIIDASRSKWQYALAGFTWLPIENGFDSLDIDASDSSNLQEMFMSLNAVDNMRLDNLGIRNGGVFEKQGTILQTEADMGMSPTHLIEDDYTKQRQKFCNIVNSIWNLGIWYEPDSAMNAYEPDQEQSGTTQMYEDEVSNSDSKDVNENV